MCVCVCASNVGVPLRTFTGHFRNNDVQTRQTLTNSAWSISDMTSASSPTKAVNCQSASQTVTVTMSMVQLGRKEVPARLSTPKCRVLAAPSASAPRCFLESGTQRHSKRWKTPDLATGSCRVSGLAESTSACAARVASFGLMLPPALWFSQERPLAELVQPLGFCLTLLLYLAMTRRRPLVPTCVLSFFTAERDEGRGCKATWRNTHRVGGPLASSMRGELHEARKVGFWLKTRQAASDAAKKHTCGTLLVFLVPLVGTMWHGDDHVICSQNPHRKNAPEGQVLTDPN